jgi:hypothetical protein
MTPSTALMDRSLLLERVLVVQTYVVPTRDRLTTSHYEIHFAPDVDPKTPPTVLLTRRVEQYAVAAAAEGTEQRFTARWHRARRDGKRVQVLDALELER